MQASMDALSVVFDPARQRYQIREGDGLLVLDQQELARLRHIIDFFIPRDE